MIIPGSRLLWLTTLVVVPVAGVGLSRFGDPALSGGLLAAFVAVAAADAWWSRRRLALATVLAPQNVRLFKHRAGVLPLRVTGATGPLRVALALPGTIRTAHAEQRIEGLAQGCAFDWPITPLERGRWRPGVCGIEVPSALGFWNVRRRFVLGCELRVYPNLDAERKACAAVFRDRGASGVHTRPRIGKGREFHQLRSYMSGDDYSDVHWKATARRGEPVTKVFQVERMQEVYVLLDSSRLSARRVADATDDPADLREAALDRNLAATLMLGRAAARQGDRFGVAAFADRIRNFVHAQSDRYAHRVCSEALYEVRPADVAPDFHEIFTFVRLRLHRRALLVVLTHLDDPVLAQQFVEAVELVRRQHLVVVFAPLPDRVTPFLSAPATESADGVYRALADHLAWEQLAETRALLARRGVTLATPPQRRLSLDLVSSYLDIKERQTL
jgi:uncharacterized protein (DUF58 family)